MTENYEDERVSISWLFNTFGQCICKLNSCCLLKFFFYFNKLSFNLMYYAFS